MKIKKLILAFVTLTFVKGYSSDTGIENVTFCAENFQEPPHKACKVEIFNIADLLEGRKSQQSFAGGLEEVEELLGELRFQQFCTDLNLCPSGNFAKELKEHLSDNKMFFDCFTGIANKACKDMNDEDKKSFLLKLMSVGRFRTLETLACITQSDQGNPLVPSLFSLLVCMKDNTDALVEIEDYFQRSPNVPLFSRIEYLQNMRGIWDFRLSMHSDPEAILDLSNAQMLDRFLSGNLPTFPFKGIRILSKDLKRMNGYYDVLKRVQELNPEVRMVIDFEEETIINVKDLDARIFKHIVIKGNNIEKIEDGFLREANIKSIDLGSLRKLQIIGNNCLHNARELKSVAFGPTTPGLPSIQHIGDYFLRGCVALETVSLLPLTNAEQIGNCFLYGTKLTHVDLTPLSHYMKNIAAGTAGCVTGLLSWCSSLECVYLPETLTPTIHQQLVNLGFLLGSHCAVQII